jgi:hypothetical protein
MNFFGPTSNNPVRCEEKKETGWFFSFAKDPGDTKKEQLSHEERREKEGSLLFGTGNGDRLIFSWPHDVSRRKCPQ